MDDALFITSCGERLHTALTRLGSCCDHLSQTVKLMCLMQKFSRLCRPICGHSGLLASRALVDHAFESSDEDIICAFCAAHCSLRTNRCSNDQRRARGSNLASGAMNAVSPRGWHRVGVLSDSALHRTHTGCDRPRHISRATCHGIAVGNSTLFDTSNHQVGAGPWSRIEIASGACRFIPDAQWPDTVHSAFRSGARPCVRRRRQDADRCTRQQARLARCRPD